MKIHSKKKDISNSAYPAPMADLKVREYINTSRLPKC